ncbi:hypothetical protein TNCV_4567081 [Trichonephila clavipes]|nr:hypothetical protein TNCV_4567081 [Trichonephila clavipes]
MERSNTPATSVIPTGKCSMEPDQANVKINLRQSCTQLSGQHDSAPSHKTSPVKQYFINEFENQIMGYGGVVDWSPRSRDPIKLNFSCTDT